MTVAKSTPTNVVTNGATPSVGGSVTFTATVSGGGSPTPTGTVSWTVSGTAGIVACTSSTTTLSGGGTATCTITAASAGTIVVSDSYNGDGNYNTVTSANATVTVAQVTPTLGVSNNVVSTGGNLVFTATVTGPANGASPTGTLAWTISGGAASCTGGTTGPNGLSNVSTYTCTINNVKASSSYSASVTYPGDGTYNAAGPATDNNVTPTKATPTPTVTDGGPVAWGGTSVFTVTVPAVGGGPTPTGTVTWTVGGTATVSSCTTSVTTLTGAGTATCSITVSKSGTYTVSATYNGDTNYNSTSSNTDTFKNSPVITFGPPGLSGFGSNRTVTYTVTITGEAAAGPPLSGSVSCTAMDTSNSTSATCTINSPSTTNGVLTMTMSASIRHRDNVTFTVNYASDTNYASASTPVSTTA